MPTLRGRSARGILAIALVIGWPRLVRAEGVLLGDEYRWANRMVVERALIDVVAIPANAIHWDADEWVVFAGFAAAIGGLTFVGDPVGDVHIDRWITRNLDDRAPMVWTIPMEATLWSTIAAVGFGTWGWAWATKNNHVAQGMSLMGEALAVSQVYHLAFKLMLGREGPEDGLGNAAIRGPAHSLRLYPSGTPSGHAATFYSLMSAAFAYFNPPWWAQAIGHALMGGLVGFHVINHKHFFSDSLWGAAMGWSIGRWVVKHRASWLFAGREPVARAVLLPFVHRQTAGLALSGAF